MSTSLKKKKGRQVVGYQHFKTLVDLQLSKAGEDAYAVDSGSSVTSSSSVTVAPQTPAILARTRQQTIHAALNLSLSGGIFIDTRFYLFSRRSSSGTASTPLSVYASSMALMDASLEFQTCSPTSFILHVHSLTLCLLCSAVRRLRREFSLRHRCD